MIFQKSVDVEMLKIEPITSETVAEQVVFIAREIWSDHYAPIIGQEQVDYMLEKFQSSKAIAQDQSAGFEYFSINIEQKLVGYLSFLVERENRSVFLSKIYIHSSARGTGIGAATMQFILAQCSEYGAETLWLTVNKKNDNSIAWYLKQGFVIVDTTVTDIGGGFVMDDYKMEKVFDFKS
jgi:ribosomal protein S18 acetylase RimI-like enzyme